MALSSGMKKKPLLKWIWWT